MVAELCLRTNIIIIIIIVSFDSEMRSRILRGEHKLQVFQRKVFGKIMLPTFRNLHKEERSDFYRSPGMFSVVKSGRLRWTSDVARI
jgi:hypothetical protein